MDPIQSTPPYTYLPPLRLASQAKPIFLHKTLVLLSLSSQKPNIPHTVASYFIDLLEQWFRVCLLRTFTTDCSAMKAYLILIPIRRLRFLLTYLLCALHGSVICLSVRWRDTILGLKDNLRKEGRKRESRGGGRRWNVKSEREERKEEEKKRKEKKREEEKRKRESEWREKSSKINTTIWVSHFSFLIFSLYLPTFKLSLKLRVKYIKYSYISKKEKKWVSTFDYPRAGKIWST